jgi:uncharacterized protein (TIGR04255 family)
MAKPDRPADLPDFERPPVDEVVLSVQFASLPALRSVHIGLFWARMRQEYPSVSEQPPLQANFETFGSTIPNVPRLFQLETLLSSQMPRYWFEGADGIHLLQLQQDRIIHNWRKRSADQTYPRYEAIRERFIADIDRFLDFLDVEKLGEVKPNQCEVTYINTIELPNEENPYRHLEKITPLWQGRLSEDYAFEIEGAMTNVRFVLTDNQKNPIGRAHIAFTPAVLTYNNKPVIRLEITVRGKPKDESISEALNLLDEERKGVVRLFAAATTPEMWRTWGRTDGN